MLYPQNGDRIVAVDFVTSFHPMYWIIFVSKKVVDKKNKVKHIK